MNSRFALETAELVRQRQGDHAAGVFHQGVSRIFFTEHADISKREIIVAVAARFGISSSDVQAAWDEHQFSAAVDMFMEEGRLAGVTGVPAMAWPGRRAIIGMMPTSDLARRLRNQEEPTTS